MSHEGDAIVPRLGQKTEGQQVVFAIPQHFFNLLDTNIEPYGSTPVSPHATLARAAQLIRSFRKDAIDLRKVSYVFG